ncbi:hypothetical protein CMUS01_09121 [Colletotrichum musicola]|uniref:Uncharacterized protein n=1 Tax=Colletotrichum musicola TaxID=2175873 RepID=A0A8H6K8U2_9PEZI|nr:hypothetical protein CMUS01_09121 [Colletotrichum musicola]
MENQQHKCPDLRRQISRKPVPPTPQASPISQPGPTEPANEPLLPSQPNDSGSQYFSPRRPGNSADTSTHKSEGEEQQNIAAEEDRPKEGNRLKASAWRIIKGWWQELACCCLGIASFAALVVVLQGSDGQPPPDWPLGLTINTAVAALSTVSRIALAIPITEGLGQAKWAWFKKRPRPLGDFDAFEQASRGIWGSLTLVVRTKGWNVDISSDGSAIAWRVDSDGSVASIITIVMDLVSRSGPYYDQIYNLPNGVSTTMAWGRDRYSHVKTYFVSLGPPLSHLELKRTRILSYFVMNVPESMEVSLYWSDGTANSHNNSEELFITSPGESVEYMVPVGGNKVITDLVNNTMTTGLSAHPWGGAPPTGLSGSDMFAQADADVEADYVAKVNATIKYRGAQKIWWESVDGMARNVAAGLTNALISSNPTTVNGTALRSETYVQVRLSWLALLGAQIVLSLIVLVAIIIETELADVDVIKSSSLPALFAISAEEKATLELGVSEGDPGARGNDRYLAPNSVDGQFKRKGNWWILHG